MNAAPPREPPEPRNATSGARAVGSSNRPRGAPVGGQRRARSAATRENIMASAERLFAERGVYAVSNRQVGEAAGQANNTAVGYHFGTKTDLIRAIIHKHAVDIDTRRTHMLDGVRGSTDIRDWIRCLVLPSTAHFAALGTPTWYARFNAQVMADPTLRAVIYEDAMASPSLQETLTGLRATAGDIPFAIRRTRADMARQLLVHMCSERERELALVESGAETVVATGAGAGERTGKGTSAGAAQGPDARPDRREDGPAAAPRETHWAGAPDGDRTAGTWAALGIDLVDALTGLWTAPVTR